MDNTMYSDGRDEFVKFSSYDNKKVFYVNLRTHKATRTKPSKVSRYHGFAKPYRYLLSKDNFSIGYKDDSLTINSMPLSGPKKEILLITKIKMTINIVTNRSKKDLA